MQVLEMYEDQQRPVTHIRWLQRDQKTPWNYSTGWSFKLEIVNAAETVVREKLTGFTGGTGGTPRDTELSNLVITWTPVDLANLGSVAGIEYELRIIAIDGDGNRNFYGGVSGRPRLKVYKTMPFA